MTLTTVTSIALTLRCLPCRMSIAFDSEVESLAAALASNTVLSSLEIELLNEKVADGAIREGGPLDTVLQYNTFVTSVKITDVTLPRKWQHICRRNACLTIHVRRDYPRARTSVSIDLTRVPWARPAGGLMDSLSIEDPIRRDHIGATYRLQIDGADVEATADFSMLHPDLYGLTTDQLARAQALRFKEIEAARILSDHPNFQKFHSVLYTMYGETALPTWICVEPALSTLHSRIYRGEARVHDDLLGVVMGLDYMHSKNLVHLHLTSQNVFDGTDGHLKIALSGIGDVPTSDKSWGETWPGLYPFNPPDVYS